MCVTMMVLLPPVFGGCQCITKIQNRLQYVLYINIISVNEVVFIYFFLFTVYLKGKFPQKWNICHLLLTLISFQTRKTFVHQIKIFFDQIYAVGLRKLADFIKNLKNKGLTGLEQHQGE